MIHQRADQGRAAIAGPTGIARWPLLAAARQATLTLLAAWLLICPLLSHALQGAQGAAKRVSTVPGVFWYPQIAPIGPVVLVVSLDEQYLYVYRNGVAIGASPISSGRAGYETPTGVYTILQKRRQHYSNLYAGSPMPFMQRLTWDGIAIHGGNLPGHPASHGCIRLPQSFAEKLFATTQHETVVVVAEARVDPASIAHPAAVAPIDLSGQPMATPLPDEHELTALASDDTPLSVVVSTHDRAVYVLHDGLLVAHSALELSAGTGFQGTVLYVLRRANTAAGETQDATQTGHLWSAYQVTGTGPAPEPAQLAKGLHVPAGFGQRLRAALVPGTTVLVTDLPGYGGTNHTAYGTLLQSDEPPAGKR